MTVLFTVLISGISFGLLYAVMGVGLVLIYRGSRVVNFAYGASIGLLAYLLSALVHALGSVVLALLVALFVAAALGYVTRYLVVGAQDHVRHQTLRLRGLFDADTLLRMVVATVGLGLIIGGVETLVWGTGSSSLPVSLGHGVHTVAGVRISDTTITIAVTSLVILTLVGLLLYRTAIGFQIRAVFDNPTAANLLGMSIGRCFTVVWVVATVVGLSAAVMASNAVYIAPTSYVAFAFTSFIAVVLGGLDSLRGAVIGGLFVGVASALVSAYWTSDANELLLLAVAIVLLWLRPQGLFSSGTESSARL